MLKIQSHLRSFSDPEKAISSIQEEPWIIKVARKDDLVLLNYDIRAPKGEWVDDCRGLILRIPDFDVVSYSFKRFYNYGEGHAANVNWQTAEVQEKLDGSLIVFFHDGTKWRMQTRGMIDASGPVSFSTEYTFYDRIINLFNDYTVLDWQQVFDSQNHDDCFVCEYVGPYNRIVTRYERENLYWLTTVNKKTLEETDNVFPPFAIKRKTYPMYGSLESLLSSLEDLPPLGEGYVVKDGCNRRIKVKNPKYLAIHNVINAGASISDKNFAEIALRGDTSEIKSYFPEYVSRINEYEILIEDIVNESEEAWINNNNIETQKEFAMNVKHLFLSAWLFAKRNGKTIINAREWITQELDAKKLVEYRRK